MWWTCSWTHFSWCWFLNKEKSCFSQRGWKQQNSLLCLSLQDAIASFTRELTGMKDSQKFLQQSLSSVLPGEFENLRILIVFWLSFIQFFLGFVGNHIRLIWLGNGTNVWYILKLMIRYSTWPNRVVPNFVPWPFGCSWQVQSSEVFEGKAFRQKLLEEMSQGWSETHMT